MKKRITLFIVLVMMLMVSAASAETKISVSGKGEVRVSADTAVISLGVNARDKDVLKAQQQVNETINAVRKALIDQDVKEENINTEFINIYAMYEDVDGEEDMNKFLYTAVLKGIKEANWDTTITATPYLTYTMGGVNTTVDGPAIEASVNSASN